MSDLFVQKRGDPLPFKPSAIDIVNRLRCIYPKGPMLPDGEPEFGWAYRGCKIAPGIKFPTPLMLEAAQHIEELTAERDNADRRAGAAERRMEDYQDTSIRRDQWLRKAKEDAGYHYNTSFDVVWADALAALKRAKGDGALRIAGASGPLGDPDVMDTGGAA
jgi:hypothetical protein